MLADLIVLLAFAAVGALLGALYFGGLWLTVRRLPTLDHPMLWLLASTLTRLALVLAAFFVVSQGHWSWLLACLAGFVAVRIVLVRRARPAGPPAKGVDA